MTHRMRKNKEFQNMVRQNVGAEIEKLLEAKNLTPEYLANELDCRLDTVINIIEGKFALPIDIFVAILDILDKKYIIVEK